MGYGYDRQDEQGYASDDQIFTQQVPQPQYTQAVKPSIQVNYQQQPQQAAHGQLVYSAVPAPPPQVVYSQQAPAPTFFQPPGPSPGMVTRDIGGPSGTVMTSTWVLPKEATTWVSNASADWRGARTTYICAMFLALLAFLLGVVYSTVLVSRNHGDSLVRGEDLFELTRFQQDMKYQSELAVESARLCALTGYRKYGSDYKTAVSTLTASRNAYSSKRGSIIADDPVFRRLVSAQADMAKLETAVTCTAEDVIWTSTTVWNPTQNGQAGGYADILSSAYLSSIGVVRRGFGLAATDMKEIQEFRRGRLWWAKYNLFIDFAVCIAVVGTILAFLGFAEANLSRAMYMWDEGAPRMLPRQCQGAGAMWNETERRSAISYVRRHPYVVFCVFFFFMIFSICPFYFEYNAQESHHNQDEITLMMKNLMEARYLDEALTAASRMCALTGTFTGLPEARHWKDVYHTLSPQMDQALAAVKDSQLHLTDRVGMDDGDTWDRSSELIADMVRATESLTAKHDSVIAVCADDTSISASRRNLVFDPTYLGMKLDFMNGYTTLSGKLVSGFNSQNNYDQRKINHGFRGTSIAFCVLMMIVAIIYIHFLLVLTRNMYEAKVPQSFKEVGLSRV